MPTYQQPQGFSSTYYRYLQQGPMGGTIVPGPMGSGPPPAAPVTNPGPFLPMEEPKLDMPPSPSEKSLSSNNTGAWWSWIRRPVSMRAMRGPESTPAEPVDDEAD
ncbi:MAG: hypothetical protein U0872_00630 [Planctomycetaceae bacterium]